MTTLTTLVGGLPLVVAPGSGSEMYRGLGAVVIGGLTVSTIFTLVLVPLVFSLVLQMREGVLATFGRSGGHGPGGQVREFEIKEVMQDLTNTTREPALVG
jgi:HAE1 family hydrophobic/amphiphilic exporter-1